MMTVAASPHAVDQVFLGGDTEGIFSSQDRGRTWTVRNEGLHDYWIEAILFHPKDPNVIYAGGFSGHGFKFASVVGEILADLVTTGRATPHADFLRAPVAAVANRA